VVTHAEQLRQLHEGATQLLRALDDPPRVADVGLEQGRLLLRPRLEGPLERLPQVAAANGRGETTDRQHAAGASGGWARHQPRWFMRVAAAAAPKPLSMFTTTTPAAQVLSIPSRAARPFMLAP